VTRWGQRLGLPPPSAATREHVDIDVGEVVRGVDDGVATGVALFRDLDRGADDRLGVEPGLLVGADREEERDPVGAGLAGLPAALRQPVNDLAANVELTGEGECN